MESPIVNHVQEIFMLNILSLSCPFCAYAHDVKKKKRKKKRYVMQCCNICSIKTYTQNLKLNNKTPKLFKMNTKINTYTQTILNAFIKGLVYQLFDKRSVLLQTGVQLGKERIIRPVLWKRPNWREEEPRYLKLAISPATYQQKLKDYNIYVQDK